MVLQNYSGDKLRVVQQIKVTVSHSGHSAKAIYRFKKVLLLNYWWVPTYYSNWDITLFKYQRKVVIVMHSILVYTNQMIKREMLMLLYLK